jgi:NitT/TauT family transport system substrate-binding protein
MFARFRSLLCAVSGAVLAAATPLAASGATAENIKIGLIKIGTGGPMFVALEKGYFAAEGLTADVVYFDSAPPIAVATVSGDVDFGIAGLTAGFYSLAGQGALRIVAGANREAPGFHFVAYLASNRAYEAGLRSPRDFAGHAIAVPQIGSANHYNVSLIAEKYGFDLKSVRLLALQSLPNVATAIAGGQADAGPLNATMAMALAGRGAAKIIGWVGDETPWQFGAVWTSTKSADNRRDTVTRFLRAYTRAAREYHDAFSGSDGKPAKGQKAPEIEAIIAKYVGEPLDQAEHDIVYVDPEARLDVDDVLRQISWYRSQGMIKNEFDSNAIIDKRYVVPLPRH